MFKQHQRNILYSIFLTINYLACIVNGQETTTTTATTVAAVINPIIPLNVTNVTTTIIAPTTNFIVPNYDDVINKIKFFDDRLHAPLVLMCNVTIPGQFNITWSRNGINVASDPALSGRYKLYNSEYKFIIDYTSERDAGEYTCQIMDEIAVIQVIANVYLREFSENTHLIEGQKLTLHCHTYGTDPEVIWKIGNETFTNSTDRIRLSNDWRNVTNAILTIDSVLKSDRKWYNCSASNLATVFGNFQVNQVGTMLRIRDRLAPLWPVCGMVIEAFVLFIVLFIYEKTRVRDEDEKCTLEDMFRPVEVDEKYTEIRYRN